MSDTATWIIAGAAVINVIVYGGLWWETRKQIALTRALFLESHAPILSVSIKGCGYGGAPPDNGLKGKIVIKNHGTVAANQVALDFRFGGFNTLKQISKIAIPPKGKVAVSLLLPMTAERYATGTGTGNHFNALIEGSCIGVAGQTYPYKDRQEYDPELKRFVSFYMNW